ncbi:MAG TPA: GGDEF domain-containing protein [Thermoleophilaceae bacterium]|jgi:diguanylate cyclase (GGDEF)-like protein|nr:GGDEF domain-containing protein [Thermoleophilaceae bacterium]
MSLRDVNPYDDGPLPDFTSGLMWFATGVFGLVAQWLPGTGHDHVYLVYGLCLFALAWGTFSVAAGLNRWTMPLELRAAVTALTMLLVALALWATGGATSYLAPILLFTALFIGWFFPPRLAWPLVVAFLFAYASPLLYDPDAVSVSFPARLLGFAVAVIGQTVAMQILKVRLVRAEVQQRTFAQLDPLTGITNRRGFDQALERAQASGGPYALVLFDLDDFKSINDEHGHPTGDVVLRRIAESAQRAVRRGDCLARIGGDEFAVVADGSEQAGADRLVRALAREVRAAEMPEELDVGVTFATAVAPDDGEDRDSLLKRASLRLLALKRAAREPAYT